MRYWVAYFILALPSFLFSSYCFALILGRPELEAPLLQPMGFLFWAALPHLPSPWLSVFFSLVCLGPGYLLLTLVGGVLLYRAYAPAQPQYAARLLASLVLLAFAQPLLYSGAQAYAQQQLVARRQSTQTRILDAHPNLHVSVQPGTFHSTPLSGYSAVHVPIAIDGPLDQSRSYDLRLTLCDVSCAPILGTDRDTGIAQQGKHYYARIHLSFDRDTQRWRVSDEPGRNSVLVDRTGTLPVIVPYELVVKQTAHVTDAQAKLEVRIAFEDEARPNIHAFQCTFSTIVQEIRPTGTSWITVTFHSATYTIAGQPFTPH
jgi:hypothetical protein